MSEEYPNITKGVGKLTPELWRRAMKALQWLESNQHRVKLKGQDRRPSHPKRRPGGEFIIAQIGYHEVDDMTHAGCPAPQENQWRYSWRECIINPCFGIELRLDGQEQRSIGGQPETFARNIAERNNDGNDPEGYGIRTRFPTAAGDINVQIKPIQDGSFV